MILRESLWPGMTRHGFSYSTQVPVVAQDRPYFPVTNDGYWLSRVETSDRELERAHLKISIHDAFRKNAHRRRSLAAKAFDAIVLDKATGCWQSTVTGLDDEQAHHQALWEIAEFDMSGEPLDQITDIKRIKMCDNDDCLNARHYDFTHKKEYRNQLLRPNPLHYDILDDGSVMPIWENEEGEETGIVLPSIHESAQDLRELQLRCPPYAESAEAPLTANGISKITIDDITGCWAVRMYYTRPHDFLKGFQYDGYGRLGVGRGLRQKGEPSYQQLGHRVVWRALGYPLIKGMVLNHECGFRPCCYPRHISQVSSSSNVLHGRRMSMARRAVSSANST